MRASFNFIFALALVCTVCQGSIIGSILNKTKFSGKVNLNTTNGINLGYQGGITYNWGGHEIDIIGLGVNFNAIPQVSASIGNLTTTVRYSGGISLTQGTNTNSTNVTISGVTTLSSGINTTYDNTTKVTTSVVIQNISDSNSLVIRSGSTLVTAKNTENLGVTGIVERKEKSISLAQNSIISAASRGVVVSNGTSLGAFTATTATTSSTNQKATLHDCKYLPNVTFQGNTQFGNQNYLAFQGTIYNSSKNGSAGFVGSTRIKGSGPSIGIFSDEALAYKYVSSSAINNSVIGTNNAYGLAKVYTGYEINTTANGSSTGLFTGGRIYQVAKNTDTANKTSETGHKSFEDIELADENLLNEESTEFLVSKIPYFRHRMPFRRPTLANTRSSSSYSALYSSWRAGALTTNMATSNTTADTNTTLGTDFKASGIDTRNWKRWSVAKNQSATASFKTTAISNQMTSIDDITVSTDGNPAFQNKMSEIKVPTINPRELKAPFKVPVNLRT